MAASAPQSDRPAGASPLDRGPATRGPARPAPYVAVGVLIAAGVVVPLLVPTYARAAPALLGLPFFYWYQMLWVLIDALVLFVGYRILLREDRRRRAAVARPDAARRVEGGR